jgi:hypothetical protein
MNDLGTYVRPEVVEQRNPILLGEEFSPGPGAIREIAFQIREIGVRP